jgi:hypothetical protein
VAHTRRGKEVDGGAGARRRRAVVGHHPAAAARAQAHRERLLARVRAELAARDGRPADHPQPAGALMAARRCGRALRLDAGGRLSLALPPVAAEATEAGQGVVTTPDDPLAAEEVALGDTSLMVLEGGGRRMTTPGLQTRPSSHARPHRRIAQGKRWVRALRPQRAAEIRGQPPWRTMRQTLDPVKVGRYPLHGKTLLPRPRVTAPMAEIRQPLGIPVPQQSLAVSD